MVNEEVEKAFKEMSLNVKTIISLEEIKRNRAVVSHFTSLTDRGKLNLSLLISSIYLVFANIILLLFLINALTVLVTIPVSYLIILLTTWYFIRDKRRSLIIATVSFMIFILINILILASRTFIRL